MVRMDYSLCWLHLAPRAIPSVTGRGQGSELHAPWVGRRHLSGSSSAKTPASQSDLSARAPLQAAQGVTGHAGPGRALPWASGPLLLWGLGSPQPPPPTSTLSLFTLLGDPFGRVFHTHPAMRCPGAQLTAVFLHSPNHASCWPSCPGHPPASQSLVCSE